jgi:hypothetical protein
MTAKRISAAASAAKTGFRNGGWSVEKTGQNSLVVGLTRFFTRTGSHPRIKSEGMLRLKTL